MDRWARYLPGVNPPGRANGNEGASASLAAGSTAGLTGIGRDSFVVADVPQSGALGAAAAEGAEAVGADDTLGATLGSVAAVCGAGGVMAAIAGVNCR